MTEAKILLYNLLINGVKVSAVGEKLKVSSPNRKFRPEIKTQLKTLKAEIIKLVSKGVKVPLDWRDYCGGCNSKLYTARNQWFCPQCG